MIILKISKLIGLSETYFNHKNIWKTWIKQTQLSILLEH